MHSSFSWRQNSHSSPAKTYRAFGNVGTQRAPTRRVFQPTWSTWRCVHRTTSTWPGVTPAACRSSRYEPWRMCHAGEPSRGLSLPTPVSISTGVARRLHDVGPDARGEVARPVVPEVGSEPVVVTRDRVWRRVREHRRRRERRAVDLDHAGDGDVAEPERVHVNRGITFSPKRRMERTIRSWGMPPRLNDPMKYVTPRASWCWRILSATSSGSPQIAACSSAFSSPSESKFSRTRL